MPSVELDVASAPHDFSIRLRSCPEYEQVRAFVSGLVSSRYVAATGLFIAHLGEFQFLKTYLDQIGFWDRDASEEIMDRILAWNKASDLAFRMKTGEFNLDVRPEYLGFIKTKLYPDQSTGVRFLTSRHRVLLADSMGIGKCVASTTRIPTSIGLLEIQELHRRFAQGERFKVLSESGMSTVTATHDEGEKPAITLKTSKGVEVTVGVNHRFRIWTKDCSIKWRRASELKPGDQLIQVCESIETGRGGDLDRAYFVGVLAGDGCFVSNLPRQVGVVINYHDFEHEHEYRLYIGDCFVKYCGKLNKWRKNRVYYTYRSCDFGQWLADQRLVDRATRLTSGRHPKRIPHFLFSESAECKVAFLSGYVDTDGCITRKTNTIEITTGSIGMRDDMVALCTSLGLKVRVTDKYVGAITGTKTLVDGTVKSHRANHTYYRVTIYSAQSFRVLENLGFRPKIKYKRQAFEQVLAKPQSGSNIRTRIVGASKLLSLVEERLRAQGYRTGTNRHRNLFAAGHQRLSKSVSLETLNKIEREFPGAFAGTPLQYVIDHQCYISEVRSVRRARAHLFDLSVDKDPTYIFNGLVSHNTVQALSTLAVWKSLKLVDRALVIGISGVKPGWATEIEKHSHFTYTILPNGTKEILAALEGYKRSPTDLLVLHYDGLVQFGKKSDLSQSEIEAGYSEVLRSILECPLDVVFADEAHLLKNMDIRRFRSFAYLMSHAATSFSQVEVEYETENGERFKRILTDAASFHLDIGDEVDVL